MTWLDADALAVIFASLTALAILIYSILDGYDLGVGITLPMQNEAWRDVSIASIGPFWDANETWLVLAVGLLLVAFPSAHSAILKALYLPATLMLIGLILRGVAFDFRAKVSPNKKYLWDWLFKTGSVLAAFSQGFMLGIYVVGLEYSWLSIVFAVYSGACVTAAYAMIGNAWLIWKTVDKLQQRAIRVTLIAGFIAFFGIATVSISNPLINANVLQVWTREPYAYIFMFIPIICFAMLVLGYLVLRKLPMPDDESAWLPFVICCVIFATCFSGLAISFYPFIVPNEMTIYAAASSEESLRIILMGSTIVLPTIVLYTSLTYYAFRGKAKSLSYY